MLSALASIVRDMRDVPRDCLRDPAELLFWLRRMANRVDGVGRMRVAGSSPSRPARSAPQTASKNGTSLAQSVFGKASKDNIKPIERRIITGRKGRAVKVETRRARQHGQMEMW